MPAAGQAINSSSKTEDVPGREILDGARSLKLDARTRQADNIESKLCLQLLESTNTRERNDSSSRPPSSKSRPPWRKRSQVQRYCVIGMVKSDTAVRSKRHRPIHVGTPAAHERASRMGQLALVLCINFLLTHFEFTRFEISGTSCADL